MREPLDYFIVPRNLIILTPLKTDGSKVTLVGMTVRRGEDQMMSTGNEISR